MEPKRTKLFYRRTWVLILIGVVALLVVIGLLADGGTEPENDPVAVATDAATVSAEDKAAADAEKMAEAQAAAQAEADAAAAAAAEAAAKGTVSQQNAYSKAQDYLSYSAFSRSGLADQLVYEGFSAEDAEFAIARLESEGGVDWNAQAAQKAADYMSYSSFSHASLVEQLEYEGFTAEQAEYGVSTTGL